MAVVDLCTDIKMEGAFENLFYDPLIFDTITKNILNYDDFLDLLYGVVNNIEEQLAQKRSVGGIIDSLYEKVGIIINQLIESTKNLTPEQLENLKETGKELVDKINTSPLAQEVFKDMAKK
jgi:hypothetical protein